MRLSVSNLLLWSVRHWGHPWRLQPGYLRKHWNTSQVQIISSDLCSMYFQLKWHHINLISIDATCNLIFQCMVFSSNWLHRPCEEVYCTYESSAHATVGGCENAFAMLLINMAVHQRQGVNSQVLNFATQILFQSQYVWCYDWKRPKVKRISKKCTAPCQIFQEKTSVLCKINLVQICKYHGHKERLCILLQVQLLACGRY